MVVVVGAAVDEVKRLAGDGASVVASLAGGGRGGEGDASCLFERSSRPRRCPRQLAAELEEAICV